MDPKYKELGERALRLAEETNWLLKAIGQRGRMQAEDLRQLIELFHGHREVAIAFGDLVPAEDLAMIETKGRLLRQRLKLDHLRGLKHVVQMHCQWRLHEDLLEIGSKVPRLKSLPEFDATLAGLQREVRDLNLPELGTAESFRTEAQCADIWAEHCRRTVEWFDREWPGNLTPDQQHRLQKWPGKKLLAWEADLDAKIAAIENAHPGALTLTFIKPP